MAKNIVICSDGTGATANKKRGTNVFKLYEAVDLHDAHLPQVAVYDDGVGSQGFKPLKLLGGAFGLGLGRNVRQLYTELARAYEPGDRIWLFGFSRGAFTVRMLSGLITRYGVLDISRFHSDESLCRGVRSLYSVYRLNYSTAVQRWLERIFRRSRWLAARRAAAWWDVASRFHEDSGDIHFIGVWDTVAALGFPDQRVADFFNSVFYRFKFPDHTLSERIGRACQALSIDDERQTFHPLLWVEDGGDPRITQVWFSGAHCNVGGGYNRHGMSLVALDWMMTEAEDAGLRFVAAPRAAARDCGNAYDKIGASRGGAALFYRYLPRDIWQACDSHGVRPKVHISVLRRVCRQTEGYAPVSLPSRSDVVGTRGEPSEAGAAAVSEEVQDFLDDRLDDWASAVERERSIPRLHGEPGWPHSVLDVERRRVMRAVVAHYFFLASALALVILACLALKELTGGFWPMSMERGGVLWNALVTGVSGGAVRAWVALGLLVVAVASSMTAVFARVMLRRDVSEFWYTTLGGLRDRLADV